MFVRFNHAAVNRTLITRSVTSMTVTIAECLGIKTLLLGILSSLWSL